MSHIGSQGRAGGPGGEYGFRGQPRPAERGNSDGPKRDAWNQPIPEEPIDRSAPGRKVDPNDPNNTGIDDTTIDNIWNEVKKENSVVDPNAPPVNTNQPAPPVDPEKQLSTYLASVGLDPIVLSDAEKAEMQAGNFDNILAKLNGKIQQSHVKALASANTMIQKSIETSVTQAVEKATGIVKGQVNLRELNSALPWTIDPAIGPIAQAVMQRFLDRKMSTADAIKGVDKFFQHTAKKMGMSAAKVNPNQNAGYRSGPSDDSEGSNNWLDVLRS